MVLMYSFRVSNGTVLLCSVFTDAAMVQEFKRNGKIRKVELIGYPKTSIIVRDKCFEMTSSYHTRTGT